MYNSYIKYKQKYLNLKKLLNDRQLLGGASSAGGSSASGGATKASTTYNDSTFIFDLIDQHFGQKKNSLIEEKKNSLIEKIIEKINSLIDIENDKAYYLTNQKEINDNISLIKDILIDLYTQGFLSIEEINNVNLLIIQIQENIKNLTLWANWEPEYLEDLKTFKENIKKNCTTILEILGIQNILDILDDKFIKYDLSSIISFIKNTKTIYNLNLNNSGDILIIDGGKFSYHINFLEKIKLFYLENNKDNIYNYYILLLNIRLYSIYSQSKTIDKLRSLKDEIIQYFTIKKEEEEERKKGEEEERKKGEEERKKGEVEGGEGEEGKEEKVEGGVEVKEVEEGVKEVEVKEEGVKEGEVKVEGVKVEGVKKKKRKNVKIHSNANKSSEMIDKITTEELTITTMIEEIQKQIDAESETIKTDSHILPGFDEISKFDNSLTMFILLEILSNFVYNTDTDSDSFSLVFNDIDQNKNKKLKVFITYNASDFSENICTLNQASKYKLYYLYDQNKYYYSKFSMFLYKYYDFKKFKVFIIPSTHSIDILPQIKHIPSLLTSTQLILDESTTHSIDILPQIKHIPSLLTSAQLILDESTNLNKIIEAILIIFKNINKNINEKSIVCALYSIIYSENYKKILIPITEYPILIIDGSNLSYNIDLLKMIKQFINNTSALSKLSKSSALIILNVRLYDKITTLLTNARQKLSGIKKKLEKLKKLSNSDITSIEHFTYKKMIQENEIFELEELCKPLKQEISQLKTEFTKDTKSSLLPFVNSINFESNILFDKRIYLHQITSILLQEILPLFLYSFLPIGTIIHITINCDSLQPRLDLKKNKYENFFVHDSSCEYITDNESDDFIAVFLYMLFLTNNKEVYLWTYDNYLWYKEQFPTIIQIEQIPNSFKLQYTTLKPYERKTPEHIIYRSPLP